MSMWFGDSWGAEVCDPERHTDTPVSQECAHCEEPIIETDRGVIIPFASSNPDDPKVLCYHLYCHLRSVVGSVGHQQGRCSCYGGTAEDPPDLTRRQAATAAVVMFYERAERTT